MHDIQKFDFKQISDRLAGDVEIKVPKKWLLLGAVGFVVLLVIAFD